MVSLENPSNFTMSGIKKCHQLEESYTAIWQWIRMRLKRTSKFEKVFGLKIIK